MKSDIRAASSNCLFCCGTAAGIQMALFVIPAGIGANAQYVLSYDGRIHGNGAL